MSNDLIMIFRYRDVHTLFCFFFFFACICCCCCCYFESYVFHVRLINLYWTLPPRFTTSLIVISFSSPCVTYIYIHSRYTGRGGTSLVKYFIVFNNYHSLVQWVLFANTNEPTTYELYLCGKMWWRQSDVYVCARIYDLVYRYLYEPL